MSADSEESLDIILKKFPKEVTERGEFGNSAHLVLLLPPYPQENFNGHTELARLKCIEKLLQAGLDVNAKETNEQTNKQNIIQMASIGCLTAKTSIPHSSQFIVTLIQLTRKYNLDVNYHNLWGENIILPFVNEPNTIYRGNLLPILEALGPKFTPNKKSRFSQTDLLDTLNQKISYLCDRNTEKRTWIPEQPSTIEKETDEERALRHITIQLPDIEIYLKKMRNPNIETPNTAETFFELTTKLESLLRKNKRLILFTSSDEKLSEYNPEKATLEEIKKLLRDEEVRNTSYRELITNLLIGIFTNPFWEGKVSPQDVLTFIETGEEIQSILLIFEKLSCSNIPPQKSKYETEWSREEFLISLRDHLNKKYPDFFANMQGKQTTIHLTKVEYK